MGLTFFWGKNDPEKKLWDQLSGTNIHFMNFLIANIRFIKIDLIINIILLNTNFKPLKKL